MKEKQKKLIGKKVIYKTKHKREEGVIKAIGDRKNQVYVVFDCNEDWDNYENYTAQSVNFLSLRDVALKEVITKEMLLKYGKGYETYITTFESITDTNNSYSIFMHRDKIAISKHRKEVEGKDSWHNNIVLHYISDYDLEYYKTRVDCDLETIELLHKYDYSNER